MICLGASILQQTMRVLSRGRNWVLLSLCTRSWKHINAQAAGIQNCSKLQWDITSYPSGGLCQRNRRYYMLVRMWRTLDPCSLSWEWEMVPLLWKFLKPLKIELPLWYSNPMSSYRSKIIESRGLKELIYNSLIHNSQKVGATWVSVNSQQMNG